MKKFFMFMAAALMTFSLASCDKKDKNEPETPAAQDTTVVENKLVFEAAVDASYASLGFLEVYGMSTDEAWYIDWLLYGFESLNTELTDENLYEPSITKVKGGKKEAEYAVSDVKLTASLNEDQTVWTIAGTFTANETKYTVEIAAMMPEPADPHEYDEEASDYAENFATYTINDKYLSDEHYLGVTAEKDSATIMLGFYVPADAESLVAGEYTVSDSEEAMTVTEGQFDGQYVYASFAGYEGEQGLTRIWYLVSGKVTVNVDGSIVVDALNSNGKKINSTLTAPAKEEEGEESGKSEAPAKIAPKAIKGIPAKKHAL